MKTIQIQNIPGMATSDNKGKLADEIVDDLMSVAREKNARLGKHKLLDNDSLQITFANDDLLQPLKNAVENAGMKFVELKAAEAFAAKYRQTASDK